jgi:endogenous inhibitor of DNA gyrase (YacG/DUF329 family)
MKIDCPICKNATTWEENPWRPFCSERCKLIDLGKWVSEEYSIDGGTLGGEVPSSDAPSPEDKE